MNNSYGVSFSVNMPTFSKNGKPLGHSNAEFSDLTDAVKFAKKYDVRLVSVSFGFVCVNFVRTRSVASLIEQMLYNAKRTADMGDGQYAHDSMHIAKTLNLMEMDRINSIEQYVNRSQTASEYRLKVSWRERDEENDSKPIPVIEPATAHGYAI